jgi:hypothetical protein
MGRIVGALRPQPGDRVLVQLREDTTRVEVDEVLGGLRGRFPGVTFTALSGATARVTVPASTSPQRLLLAAAAAIRSTPRVPHGIGAAVAVWLECVARDWADEVTGEREHALLVARAVGL